VEIIVLSRSFYTLFVALQLTDIKAIGDSTSQDSQDGRKRKLSHEIEFCSTRTKGNYCVVILTPGILRLRSGWRVFLSEWLTLPLE